MSARPIRLFRAFATVGGWTMGSRVLGFARDVMIAALLGAGPVAEAFFVAFRLPNMFRRFFAEGAFNMAFVPLFAKRLEGGEDAKGFAEEAMAGLVSILLFFTVLAILFMPVLMLALAGGFADDEAKFDLAVAYGRVQFRYLLCLALTALFSGVLNAMGRFAAPAAAPVLLNVILIGAMAVAAGVAAPAGDALSLGVLAAGFAQVALVARAARQAGMELRLRRPRWSPAMKRLVTLGVPGALAGGVTQVNLLIGTVIASFYAGAVAWLNYADRIYQLPLGVVGVAIGVVLLPELSRRVRASDAAGAQGAFNRAAE
ncbi:MAG: murein biosynthesis integral membrane protein MurJ, partial [Pseudomonadota bacterium]